MDNAVEIRGLCKSFGSFGLRDVDLDIPRGYVVGLIGENGAGKTTLIKCITGANLVDSGTISLFGSQDRKGTEGRVGVVFDECHFFQQMRAIRTAPMVKRMASRYWTGMASRAFFIIKKELPQMKAAAKSIGFASFFITFPAMENSS